MPAFRKDKDVIGSASLRIMSIFSTMLCIYNWKMLKWVDSVSKEIIDKVSHHEMVSFAETGPLLASITQHRNKKNEQLKGQIQEHI